jgi:hypothetical protein
MYTKLVVPQPLRNGNITKRSHQEQARLNTSMDSVLSYSAAIKRDLYRAIGALRDMRDRAE